MTLTTPKTTSEKGSICIKSVKIVNKLMNNTVKGQNAIYNVV